MSRWNHSLREDLVLCYQEGFRAYVKHTGKSCESPYLPTSTQNQAFAAGWHFAATSFADIAPPAKPNKHKQALATAQKPFWQPSSATH
jgi:hypothetical protein